MGALDNRNRAAPFSILERIELGETWLQRPRGAAEWELSVSSNGSNWVKPIGGQKTPPRGCAFSILERIELGETSRYPRAKTRRDHFQYPRTDRIG